MEKQKGQAEGNQNLEVTKALLKPGKAGESSPNIPAAVGYNALTQGQSGNTLERDSQAAAGDSTASLGSQYFNPGQDLALNPSIRLGN